MKKEQAIKEFQRNNEIYSGQLERFGRTMTETETKVIKHVIERNEAAIAALTGEITEEDVVNWCKARNYKIVDSGFLEDLLRRN